jgi:phosphatidylserine decarboxylase
VLSPTAEETGAKAVASIVDSIRSNLAPVRREGWPFIGIALTAAIVLGWFWQPFFWAGMILAVWCAYFFRDPARVIPIDPLLVVSPADGRVVSVAFAAPPGELGVTEAGARRISIFMSILDCHVNRAPIAGTIRRMVYKPGKFFNAELDKASLENERSGMVLDTRDGTVVIVQIAGLIARRIVRFVAEGDSVAVGERIGLIRFGSRVDVYLPPTADVIVAEGQTAIAGETVIARFGGAPTDRRARID